MSFFSFGKVEKNIHSHIISTTVSHLVKENGNISMPKSKGLYFIWLIPLWRLDLFSSKMNLHEKNAQNFFWWTVRHFFSWSGDVKEILLFFFFFNLCKSIQWKKSSFEKIKERWKRIFGRCSKANFSVKIGKILVILRRIFWVIFCQLFWEERESFL